MENSKIQYEEKLNELELRKIELLKRKLEIQSELANMPISSNAVSSEEQNNTLLKEPSASNNYISLIAAILMAVSAVLPWAEVNSKASFMGQTSTFYSSATGIQSGVGYFVILMSLIAGYLGFTRNKWAFTSGILNLIIGLNEMTGLGRTTLNIGIATGSAGYGIGVLILVASSAFYIISTLKQFGNK